MNQDQQVQYSTYYAVLHGKRWDQIFAAMRCAPSVSAPVFSFEAPPFQDDTELNAYFERQFLPLRVVYYEGDKEHVSEEFRDFRDAYEHSYSLRKAGHNVRILTLDGREVALRESEV